MHLSSKFHLENPKSSSWVRSRVKVTLSEYHAVFSYAFCLKSNIPSIHEIQLFFQICTWISKNSTSMSWVRTKLNVRVTLTHIHSVHVNQPSHYWDVAISKFHLENPRSRLWVKPGGGYSAWKLMGVCRWPLKIGPKKIEEKIEFGAKKIDFCKNW